MICAVLFALLLFAVSCAYLALINLFRLSSPTVTDAIAMLRRVDERELEDLWSDTIEQNLRSTLLAVRFREVQRTRAKLLVEYLRRTSFNALVLLSWAYVEQEKLQRAAMPADEEKTRLINDLLQESTAFRAYALLALPKLLWQLFQDGIRLKALRSVAGLRRVGEADGLEAYRRLAEVAAALGAHHGTNQHRQLVALLRGGEFGG